MSRGTPAPFSYRAPRLPQPSGLPCAQERSKARAAALTSTLGPEPRSRLTPRSLQETASPSAQASSSARQGSAATSAPGAGAAARAEAGSALSLDAEVAGGESAAGGVGAASEEVTTATPAATIVAT